MTQAQSYEFKAEVKQLLDILVHSLYTRKEVFLRELISNASDALEKVRFEQGRGADVADPDLDLGIEITLDKDAKTLTITDTGVGMTRDEMVENIGTIAHSGSAEFVRRAIGDKAGQDKGGLDSLIGQFGVGFYSVYMVADAVTIHTRSIRPEATPVSWRSDGQGSYEIEDLSEATPRGARIEVTLKEAMAEEFTDPETIKGIIKRHSSFVSFPVRVNGERVNTVPALWREPKFSITKEKYTEFYQFLTHDTAEPQETLHVAVDAPVQFSALLFIPPKSLDIFGMDREKGGLDLYVRRVLIEHENKDLLPQYLRFVRGVVDTEDLPLNVARESLQDNLLIRKMATTLTKHILDHLEKVARETPERYLDFWREHQQTFKAGYADFANRDKYAGLLRFNSSACEDGQGLVSLEQYVARAKEGQKEIYYVSAPSREAARLSPHLEIFRRKGLEVFYLFEPIDEFNMDAVREFKDFTVKAAEHADLAALEAFADAEAGPEKPAALAEDEKTTFDSLLGRMKEILGERITEVKASTRLSGSPCCLVNPDGAMTSSMEKVMRVLTKDASIPKKVMEVNVDHPLIRNLIKAHGQANQDEFVTLAVEQLFESALLLEGYLSDPHALVGRMQDLLTRSSGWYLGRQA